MEANRTCIIPLEYPSGEEHDSPQQTQVKYQHCQNQTSDYCWPDTPTQPNDLTTSKEDAENALYDDLHEETDYLHSNLVQKAIKDVTSAMTTLTNQLEESLPHQQSRVGC